MSSQPPTIGRIVLFCLGYDEAGALVERPARVVNTKDGVNLVVDIEPTDDDVTKGTHGTGGAAVSGAEVARLSARRCDVQETTLDGPMIGCYRWPVQGTPGGLDPTAALQKLFASFEDRVGGNVRDALGKIDPEKVGNMDRRIAALEHDLYDPAGTVAKNVDAAASLIEGLGGAMKEQIAHMGLRVDDLERKGAAGPGVVSSAFTAPDAPALDGKVTAQVGPVSVTVDTKS